MKEYKKNLKKKKRTQKYVTGKGASVEQKQNPFEKMLPEEIMQYEFPNYQLE